MDLIRKEERINENENVNLSLFQLVCSSISDFLKYKMETND